MVMCVLVDWLNITCRSISFIMYIFLIFGIITRRCWIYGCTISKIVRFTRYFSVQCKLQIDVFQSRRFDRIRSKNCCAVTVCIIIILIKSSYVLISQSHESIESDVRRYTYKWTINDNQQSSVKSWTVQSDVHSTSLLSIRICSGPQFSIVLFVLFHLSWLQFRRTFSQYKRRCRVFTVVQVWLCT